jgi:hypothetical protein
VNSSGSPAKQPDQPRQAIRPVATEPVAVPNGAPSWVTAELIEHTLEVWQPFYANQLIPDDALEMIMGVDQLFGVMSRAIKNETLSSTGKSQQS